jgi:anthranilate synthase component 1
MKDVLGVPESMFMLYDTVVAFDHFFQVVKVITYVKVPDSLDDLEAAYNEAKATLQHYISILKDKDIPLPEQVPIKQGQEYKSNIGQDGYENHVKKLKEHIVVGDIVSIAAEQTESETCSTDCGTSIRYKQCPRSDLRDRRHYTLSTSIDTCGM